MSPYRFFFSFLFAFPPRADPFHIRKRYAYDAIHNAIASSRSPLQTGGYSRVSFNCGTETISRSLLDF